jgi:hypothetical protein
LKKFLFILSFFICSLGLSVSSMALYSADPSSFGDVFVEKDDRYALSFEIKASQFNTDAAFFWSQWTDAFIGDDPTKIALAYVSSGGKDVKFLLLDSNYTFFNSSSGIWFMSPPSTSSSYFPYITVSCSTGLASGISKVTYSNPYSVSGTNFCFSGYSKLFNLPEKFKYVDFGGKPVEITDDLGTFEEPEEPDPPSSSEPGESIPDTPKPPDYTPAEPVIPDVGSDLVPYDTSVWKTFLDRTRRTIGSITNVAFLLFFLAFAFPLLIKIIKKFTK